MYTCRAPGFVPVANVQLLIRTSAVLSSFVMAPSVVRCSLCNERTVLGPVQTAGGQRESTSKCAPI